MAAPNKPKLPTYPKPVGTGPQCEPLTDKFDKKSTAKKDCIKFHLDYLNSEAKKVSKDEATVELKKAQEGLTGYFDYCTSKNITYCPISYPHHVNIQKEIILRGAAMEAEVFKFNAYNTASCACTILEGFDNEPDDPCDCETSNSSSASPSSSGCVSKDIATTSSEPNAGCTVVDINVLETTSPTYTSISDNRIECSSSISSTDWGLLSNSVSNLNTTATKCVSASTRTSSAPDSKDSDGGCGCPNNPFSGTYSLNDGLDVIKNVVPNSTVDTINSISEIPTTTVSEFGLPIEHVFGTHFLGGNIIWVEKANYTTQRTITEIIDYANNLSVTTVFSSGNILETELDIRATTFGVGVVATGVDQINRVWVGEELIYDKTSPTSNNQLIDIVYGGPTAKVRERMTATHGFGRTPAYRDLVTIVLDTKLVVDKINEGEITTAIPELKVEVISDIAETITTTTSLQAMTDSASTNAERIMVDYNQQKIFQSMVGNRFRVVDTVTLEEIEIIQFPPGTHMESVYITQGVEYFNAQINTNEPHNYRADGFFNKKGELIYSPASTLDTPHYPAGYSNADLGKYLPSTRTSTFYRKAPFAQMNVGGFTRHAFVSDDTLWVSEYEDIMMWSRYLFSTNNTPSRTPETINTVERAKVRFYAKGDMYIDGFIGVSGNKNASAPDDLNPIHLSIRVVRGGDSSITSSLSDSTNIIISIPPSDLNVYHQDVTVHGTITTESGLVIFASYDNGKQNIIFLWDYLDGVKWKTSLQDKHLPILGEDQHIDGPYAYVLTNDLTPSLYSIDVSTGAFRLVDNTGVLEPYNTSVPPTMFYDPEFDAITYYAADNKFKNLYVTHSNRAQSKMSSVLNTIPTKGGTNISTYDLVIDGFRTGALLSWQTIIENIQTTYGLYMVEDETIRLIPRSGNNVANITHNTGLKKSSSIKSITTAYSSVSVQYYDADKLGAISEVVVSSPEVGHVASTVATTPHTFVSGGLLDRTYATQLADSLLFNNAFVGQFEADTVVGQRNLLIAPGDSTSDGFTIQRVSYSLSDIGLKMTDVVTASVTPPPHVQTVTPINFDDNRPLAKPLIIRPPLEAPYKSGFNSGNIGLQYGAVDIPTRGTTQYLNGLSNSVTKRVEWGRAVSVLPPVVNPFTTDYDSSVKVMFDAPPETTPTDATVNQLLEDDSLNVLALGNETVQFLTVTAHPTDQRVFTFKGFFRGRFGTEEAHLDHTINELVVLNDSVNKRVITETFTATKQFVKMTSAFNLNTNSGTNEAANFPSFIVESTGKSRGRTNIGQIWAYDDLGRDYTPVNIRRIDDPYKQTIYIKWDFRDSSEVWFKDTIRAYEKRRAFDMTIDVNGGVASSGNKAQHHLIERNYYARAAQESPDVSPIITAGWKTYGLSTNTSYVPKRTFGNLVKGEEYERHELGVYIVDRSNGQRWGSSPGASVWSWNKGLGFHNEFVNSTRVTT